MSSRLTTMYALSEVRIWEGALRSTSDEVLLAAAVHERAERADEGREVLRGATLDIQVDTVMRR